MDDETVMVHESVLTLAVPPVTKHKSEGTHMDRSWMHRLLPLNEKREIHVETIRGMACLALVSYHVVGSLPTNGMELPINDWLSLLQQCIADMRMPLFSFVSGYVFVSIARPGTKWYQLLLKKVRRLLLPLISVTTIFWLLRHLMGYTQTPLYLAYIFPFEHFWFLQATFLLMTTLLVVNAACAGRDGALTSGQAARNAVIVGAVGAACHILSGFPHIAFFSTFQAIHLAPFFMAGHVLGLIGKPAFGRLSETAKPWAAIVLAGLVLLGGILAFRQIRLEPFEWRQTVSILIGLGTALSLFILRPRNRLLAWIGDKSYTIYLFHVFFTAATLQLWQALFRNADIHFAYLPALVMGLAGPMIAHSLILRSPWASWILLGLKPPVFWQKQKAAL